MDKNKKIFLDNLWIFKDPERAIEESQISSSDYKEFFNDEEFVKEHEKIFNIIADLKFLELVASGERNSVLEYKKIQNKKSDLDEIQRIKEQTMEELITVCESKSQVLKKYIAIFDLSMNMAEKTFKKILHERRLISPQERLKKEEEERSTLLVERFKSGTLSEVDMYRKIMEIHLKDTEKADYPSERQRASQMVIDINRRLEEIEERERRKESESMIDVKIKVDSILLGASYEQVIEKSQIFLEAEED